MALEEAKDVAAGVISLHKLSQSGFLRLALDLEEKQYVDFQSYIKIVLIHSTDEVSVLVTHVSRQTVKNLQYKSAVTQ